MNTRKLPPIPETVQAWFNREQGNRNVHLDYMTKLREAAVELEAKYASALDDALRKSQLFNEATERAEKAEAALAAARV